MQKLLQAIPFLLLAGCNTHALKSVELSPSSTPSGRFDLDLDRRADILFVIDNSGSMAEEQANLAANFGPFIKILDAAGVDYRIAITTTDLGGWGCMSPQTGGSFAVTSCIDHPGDFVSSPPDLIDYFQDSCASVCSLSTEDLGLSDPWIERSNGVTNLAEGVLPLEAFSCLAPQGIRGCGWESPLEAMNRFVEQGQEQEFFRPGAMFSVVILTDEEDCSRPSNDVLSNHKFWTDPNVSYPRQSVCWNAGVSCVGNACLPQDYDSDAVPTSDPSEAVIFSMSRYHDLLSSFERVSVSIIAGVTSSGDVVYGFSQGEFTDEFGVDPGCGTQNQGAVPPVRLWDIADSKFSICDQDYTPSVTEIVTNLVEDLPPACFESCILDQDDNTPELDPSCVVLQVGSKKESLPQCEPKGQLPAGANACWGLIEESKMSPECLVAGQNAEFFLVRRAGVPVDPETTITVSCEVSAFPSIDCP